MTINDLNTLVQSLSKSERNLFLKSHANKHKNYIMLFEFLINHPHLDSHKLVNSFKLLHPEINIESAAQYLLKLISDELVLYRVSQDDWYKQYFGIMKAKLFSERSLEDRALIELAKVEKISDVQQNYNSLHQALRMELLILSSRNFERIDEQELVNKQMKLKSIIQYNKQLHEHYSLFELLNYRFSRTNVDQSQDKGVQDLILNELSLSSRGNKNIFEMQKTHLMFQSFFFIRIGEHHAALKVFDKLIELFERHRILWNNPPYDYLYTLDGILDSLRSISFFDEMEKYLVILEKLVDKSYTHHFNQKAKLTRLCYKFNSIIAKKEPATAKELLKEVLKEKDTYNMGSSCEKAAELNFHIALTELLSGNLKQARKSLGYTNEYGSKKLPIFRARLLLSIIINFSIGELSLIEYDIRSYKRYFTKNANLLKTEKLIFNFMMSAPHRKSKIWKSRYMHRIEKKLEEIRLDKQETQFNKFYSFPNWITSCLT